LIILLDSTCWPTIKTVSPAFSQDAGELLKRDSFQTVVEECVGDALISNCFLATFTLMVISTPLSSPSLKILITQGSSPQGLIFGFITHMLLINCPLQVMFLLQAFLARTFHFLMEY